jgi:hypothetical protein
MVAQLHVFFFSGIVSLNAYPEFDRSTEIAGETQSRVRADTASTAANLIDPPGRNIDIFGQLVLADIHRFQKLFKKNFTGVDGRKITHDEHL